MAKIKAPGVITRYISPRTRPGSGQCSRISVANTDWILQSPRGIVIPSQYTSGFCCKCYFSSTLGLTNIAGTPINSGAGKKQRRRVLFCVSYLQQIRWTSLWPVLPYSVPTHLVDAPRFPQPGDRLRQFRGEYAPLSLYPPQRPSQPPQRDDLLFLFFAQDIAHLTEPNSSPVQFPDSTIPLAGFQVSTHGRFWVSPEVDHSCGRFLRLHESNASRISMRCTHDRR